MARPSSNRNRPPLDPAALERMALHYVGRYATTRAKLRLYLARKLRERDWAGETAPAVDGLVERVAALGYVDDRQFAEARAASLGRRGYGAARQQAALAAAGIEADARAEVIAAQGDPIGAALAFARRRRIGPYAAERPDRDGRRRALAAMMRAGHPPAIAARVVDCDPGAEPERDD